MNPLIQLKKQLQYFSSRRMLRPFADNASGKSATGRGYPNFTTAEGTNALQGLTTGSANTAVGWYSLFSSADASFNTGVGAGIATFTQPGIPNTRPVGTVALLLNTTGTANTAIGTDAMSSITILPTPGNTAVGNGALF